MHLAAPPVPQLAGDPLTSCPPGRPPLAVVVDEREWVARALIAVLAEEGYATFQARTAEQAVRYCESTAPDVVFIGLRFADGRSPAMAEQEAGGLALCRRLRRTGAITDAVPVVLTTTAGVRRDDVVDALRAGAWDLCTLPVDGSALLGRCAVWVRAKRHADRTADLGVVDAATGFYNLRGLFRRAAELTQGATRAACEPNGAPALACIAFSLSADAPPAVAATWDALALRLREACAGVVRGSDVVARIGMRDFAILAPGSTRAGADRLVERLRVAVGALAMGVDGPLAVRAVVRAADGGGRYGVDATELVAGTVTALHGDDAIA